MSFDADLAALGEAATRFGKALESFNGARLRAMAAQMDAATAALTAALGDPDLVAAQAMTGVQDPTPQEVALARHPEIVERIVAAHNGTAETVTVDRSAWAGLEMPAASPTVGAGEEPIEHGYVGPNAAGTAGPPPVAADAPPWETQAAAAPATEAPAGGRRTLEQIASDEGVKLDDVKAWKTANSVGGPRVKAQEIADYAALVRQQNPAPPAVAATPPQVPEPMWTDGAAVDGDAMAQSADDWVSPF